MNIRAQSHSRITLGLHEDELRCCTLALEADKEDEAVSTMNGATMIIAELGNQKA